MTRLTPAQRSNFLSLTTWGYSWWRARSLSLLGGETFGLEREKRLFLTLARPQEGERWLDIGTSTGFYAGVLARAGCRVDAVDLSPAMLRAARQQQTGQRQGSAVNWLCLNAEKSGLPGESYDGITIGATLNETADPAAMLREAARLLKPGGQLWLMYAAANGSPEQRVLALLGGLTFPDLGWAERQMPELTLIHCARFGQVEFALMQKGSRTQKEHCAAPQV